MGQRTGEEPEEVIQALRDWLNMVGTWHPNHAAVSYWVNGDSDEAVDKQYWVFTFGYDHKDPREGHEHESLGAKYVQIKASDSETARTQIISLFDHNWAMQYKSVEEATGYGRYTLEDMTNELIPEQWRPKHT